MNMVQLAEDQYTVMNCKNCGYKYCAFRGVDREILAHLCEDFKPAKKDGE